MEEDRRSEVGEGKRNEERRRWQAGAHWSSQSGNFGFGLCAPCDLDDSGKIGL
jgi:hypothetical protein